MKKFFKYVILITILLLVMSMGINWYVESHITEQEEKAEETNREENRTEEAIVEKVAVKRYTKEGYEIVASLEIPKIDLKTDVLAESSTEALLVSVSRFWGAKPNQVGNFCIAGHNYKRDNMFYRLKELKVGDEIILTDNIDTSITYVVYSITKVSPKDVSCLSQDTNGKREITLITCTTDSKKRIIVKAREK